MIASTFMYAGLLLMLLGGLSMLRPLRFMRIRTRRAGAIVGLAGLLFVIVVGAWPAAETRVSVPRTCLDEFVPVYQFSERHSIRVEAPPERVFQAVKAVKANEIMLFRTLTGIRRGGRKGPESILDAPERMPLLEVATRTSFLTLAEEPPAEVVIGTVLKAPPRAPRFERRPEAFKALTQPGYAKAAMNFVVEPEGPGGSMVVTETRVMATDRATARSFAVYWRLNYPGSAIIRKMWLRAVKARAEEPS